MNHIYVNHINTPRSFTLLFEENGEHKSRTFQANTDEFVEAQEIIKTGDFPRLIEVLTAAKITKVSKGKATVTTTGKVVLNNEELPHALSERMKMMAKSGTDVEPLELFWKRLKKNPSENSRNQLFRFVENNGVTILEDGRFLLYKGLRDDLKSIHDGKTQHAVGEYTSIPRSQCDDNPNAACSSGLHVAPYKHALSIYGGSGRKMVEMIVDPEDVVSVPSHDREKMRVCRYFTNAVVNKDGVGIRTGLIAYSSERPVTNAEKSKSTSAPAPAAAPKSKRANATTKKRVSKKDKKEAKKQAKTAAKKAASKPKHVLPAAIKIDVVPKTTVPGKFMAAAGFQPTSMVRIGISKTERALVILPAYSAESLAKRHKVKLLDDEHKLSSATALRIGSAIFREAGIRKKTLTVTAIELNVVKLS